MHPARCLVMMGKEYHVQKGWGHLPRATRLVGVQSQNHTWGGRSLIPAGHFFLTPWPQDPLGLTLSFNRCTTIPLHRCSERLNKQGRTGAAPRRSLLPTWCWWVTQTCRELPGWGAAQAGVSISQQTVTEQVDLWPSLASSLSQLGTPFSQVRTIPPLVLSLTHSVSLSLPSPCPLSWEKLSRGFRCF